jgi:GNAT superfamily N-acetyltransferase
MRLTPAATIEGMTAIRRIGADDWQLLRATRLAALKDAPEAFESTYADALGFDEARWRRRAEQIPTFLAFDGADPVGMAGGYPEEHRPGTRDLISMWVSPTVRGRGVAGQLIDAVAGWARDDGAAELHLWVVTGNAAARAAYVRAGFVATGDQQPVKGDDHRVEERMVLALR